MELSASGGDLSQSIVELEVVPEDRGGLKIAIGLSRMDSGNAAPVGRSGGDLGLSRDGDRA